MSKLYDGWCWYWSKPLHGKGPGFFVQGTFSRTREGCLNQILGPWQGELDTREACLKKLRRKGGRCIKIKFSAVFDDLDLVKIPTWMLPEYTKKVNHDELCED